MVACLLFDGGGGLGNSLVFLLFGVSFLMTDVVLRLLDAAAIFLQIQILVLLLLLLLGMADGMAVLFAFALAFVLLLLHVVVEVGDIQPQFPLVQSV